MKSSHAMIDPLWIDELERLAKLGLDDDGLFVERDAPMSITARSSVARHPRMTVCWKRVAFEALIALDADTTGPILQIPALVGDERAVVVCQLARLWGVERVFYLGDPDPIDAVCFAALSSLLRREAGVRDVTWLSHSGLSELEIERNRRMCEFGLCAIEREIVARWTDPALIELSDGPLATELARWTTRAMKVELEGLHHLADPRPSLRAQLG